MESQIKTYDIAVIGLGPAGAFFACHANKNLRIIALDKKHSDKDSFKKPCGGLLAPDAQKVLSRFGMTLPKDILVDPQIFSVRTIDLDSNLLRHYQRHYINLDRHKFDMWLISQIPNNIELHSGAVCTKILRSDNGYLVSYLKNGKIETIFANYLVGADGAASVVRRTIFKNYKLKKYISIQQWFVDKHNAPFYSCVFDSAITDSYAWGLSKDGCFIFGGAFDIKSGKKDFESLKEKLKSFNFKLDNPIKTEICMVLNPKNNFFNTPAMDNVFLIGEAAGFISPSSLEGISYAIESGYLLSQCFKNKQSNPIKLYLKKIRKIKSKLFSKSFKRLFLYNPFARKLVMKSKISSIEILE